jgi:RimJ/RimL family protein N-acetyltransferase
LDRIVLNDPHWGAEVARIAGTHYFPEQSACVMRLRDDEPVGGVIYTGYTSESIVVHSGAWTPHWLNRDMLYVVFDYPFNQLGVKRLFGHVPEDNRHARLFNEKMGFRYVARIEGVFKHGVACMVMRLDREDCRFLWVRPRTIISGKPVH